MAILIRLQEYLQKGSSRTTATPRGGYAHSTFPAAMTGTGSCAGKGISVAIGIENHACPAPAATPH